MKLVLKNCNSQSHLRCLAYLLFRNILNWSNLPDTTSEHGNNSLTSSSLPILNSISVPYFSVWASKSWLCVSRSVSQLTNQFFNKMCFVLLQRYLAGCKCQPRMYFVTVRAYHLSYKVMRA